MLTKEALFDKILIIGLTLSFDEHFLNWINKII
jgi:hypothetical protein